MSEKVGEIHYNKKGDKATIVKYVNKNEVYVIFEGYNEYFKYRYNNLKRGEFKNPFTPSVHGVGYIGVGDYKPKINGKYTKYYTYWNAMLQRCYDNKLKEDYSTYEDCFANKETHCLQDFGKWFDKNYYEIEGEQMCLDKDILVKGNKEYRFDRMIFVPQRINKLFTKSDASRGKYPIGVCYSEDKYIALCRTKDGQKYLGSYNTQEEAFLVYKKFKEQYIKEVADEYKGRIPNRLYEAMYNWKVEIND